MDSVFCVLRGWFDMFERVFYVSTLVKKHRYFPTVIYVDGINEYFDLNNRWL